MKTPKRILWLLFGVGICSFRNILASSYGFCLADLHLGHSPLSLGSVTLDKAWQQKTSPTRSNMLASFGWKTKELKVFDWVVLKACMIHTVDAWTHFRHVSHSYTIVQQQLPLTLLWKDMVTMSRHTAGNDDDNWTTSSVLWIYPRKKGNYVNDSSALL